MTQVCSKVSSILFIIKRLSNLVDSGVLLSAYRGVVFPFLSYGVMVWGCGARKYTKKGFSHCGKDVLQG
jgi:hypothetical protein